MDSSGGEPCGRNAADAPIHHQLLVAFSHSNRAMQARTRTVGLKPGQPKVLEQLLRRDGCNQRAIAEGCVMDKSTVTSVLARMEEAGLIEREVDPGDRRGMTVALTARGRDAAERVCSFGAEVDRICLDGFTDEEAAQLSRLLGRVIDNLSHAEGEA